MRRRRDERGAVAIFVAIITCFTLVPLAAFAVDIGVQRVARRDMQSLADVVALDLARQLNGRTAAEIETTLQHQANKSMARNDSAMGTDISVTPVLGEVDPSKYGAAGYFTEVHGSAVPTAVRVEAATSVDFAFSPGKGGANRTAVAVTDSTACFDLGSYAAAIRSGDSALLSPLNDLLGLNLSLVSYQGLANESVTLADLAADSHIGGVDSLLTSGVSYGDLVRATIDVVKKNDPTNTVVLNALGKVLSAGGPTGKVKLGDQLSISPNDTAALETDMNVLNLLAGAVLVADGKHAVDVSHLQAGVAGLGNIFTSTLSIIQGLQRACGAVNSAQAHATASQLSGVITFPSINLSSLNLGIATLQTSAATGTLTVDLGNAEGQLVGPPVPGAHDVHCGAGNAGDPDTYSVEVSSDLARINLHSQLTVSGKVKLDLGGLLGGILGSLSLVDLNIVVDIDIDNSAPPTSQTLDLSLPPNDVTPKSTGSGTVLTPANVTATVNPASTAKVAGSAVPLSSIASTTNLILAGLVSPTAPFMTKTLDPLIENVNDLLLTPLQRLLGLTLAGADVYAVPRPVCQTPRLAG